MIKRVIFGLLIAVGVSSVPQAASAHVLVMDASGTQGAIMHIMPDDDPIAGEEAIIYFDRQGIDVSSAGEVSLVIRNEEGEAAAIPVETKDALTSAKYTFSKQGVYELRFIVNYDSQELSFTQSQRVTRGVTDGSTAASSHLWAEGLLVVSGVGFLVLGVLFMNRRGEIKNYSKF
ncbi:MAG: hypothetical protein ACREGE_01485 [Candidatus Microsaccharimonas sp.]